MYLQRADFAKLVLLVITLTTVQAIYKRPSIWRLFEHYILCVCLSVLYRLLHVLTHHSADVPFNYCYYYYYYYYYYY